MKQLTANVFIETGLKGANHGFVMTSDGIVLIDTPQKPSDAVRLKDEISRHGRLRYSHSAPEESADIVSLRVSAIGRLGKPQFPELPAAKRSRRRTPGAACVKSASKAPVQSMPSSMTVPGCFTATSLPARRSSRKSRPRRLPSPATRWR